MDTRIELLPAEQFLTGAYTNAHVTRLNLELVYIT